MQTIDVINWQGKKLPAQYDQPDKTIFMTDSFGKSTANLVLYPLEKPPAAELDRLGSFISVDRNILKSRITGRGFMMLKRSENPDEISSCVVTLSQNGYKARMLRDNMYFRVPAPRRAGGMEFSGEGAAFLFGEGTPPVIIPKGEPVFCVIADLKSTSRLAAIKANDANPQPVSQPFSFSRLLERINSYTCDLYIPYRWAAVRIESGRFNYTCLGAAAGGSSAENLAKLLDRLSAFPLKLVWDDRYPETSLFGMRTQIDTAVAGGSVASASMHISAEEAPFNLYSRFRYMLELLSGLKCFS